MLREDKEERVQSLLKEEMGFDCSERESMSVE